MPAVIKHFFDAPTFTFTYVVHDTETKQGVVIDPVLNYEPAAGKCTTESVKHLVNYVESENISICLLYTSPSPRDATLSRMPSSA